MKHQTHRLLSLHVMLTAFLYVSAIGANSIQAASFSIKVGALGGLTLPQGSLGDFYNNGWHAGGFLWAEASALGLCLEGHFHKMSRPGSFLGTPRFSGNLRQTAVMLNLTYSVTRLVKLRPYAAIGVGSVKSIAREEDNTYGSSYESESSDGALCVGGGARFGLIGLQALIETRYLVIFTPESSTKMILVSIGLAFPLL